MEVLYKHKPKDLVVKCPKCGYIPAQRMTIKDNVKTYEVSCSCTKSDKLSTFNEAYSDWKKKVEYYEH